MRVDALGRVFKGMCGELLPILDGRLVLKQLR